MDGNNRVLGGQGQVDNGHPVDLGPMWVTQLDLANLPNRLDPDRSTPAGTPYRWARVLVRFQCEPIAIVTVELVDGSVDLEDLQAEVVANHRADIDRIAGSGWSPDSSPPSMLSAELDALRAQDLAPVSIVIGTRNRPDHVVECVQRVLVQDYPAPFEVIVVDNGASDGATADAVRASFGDDDRVRYLAETEPGLSRARNIGLAAARHPVTAFLSDDIRVDPTWLLAIARGFGRHQDVHCVTGFCPPMYLDTDEQLLFESSMAWGTRQGFSPVLYAFRSAEDPVHPYRAGSFVNGSNMIFDTAVFRSMGGFDETLGPGTKARGGEDLDAPIRILSAGGLIAFEPAVIGWHADTYDDRSFSKHMYTYGLGLTAFLTKHLIEKESRRAVVSRIPQGFPMLLKAFGEPDEALSKDLPVPLKYHLWHLLGRLAGPFAYLASRRARAQ